MKSGNYPKNLQEFIILYLYQRDEYIQVLETKVERLEKSLYNFEHKKDAVICQGCRKVYGKNDRDVSREWPNYIIVRCSGCGEGFICQDCADMNSFDSIFMQWKILVENGECRYCRQIDNRI